MKASQFQCPDGQFVPPPLNYSGAIAGETRKLAGANGDALITATPLPLGTELRGKQLSLTFGTLSGSGTTGISEMFEIDQVLLTNGQYHICLKNDHMLEITNGTTTVEQMAPLRTFSGSNQFEISLSASQLATMPGVPTGFAAAPGNAQVALNWNASGGTSNKVWCSLTHGGPYVVIATPTLTTFTDPNVSNGVTYHYVISAVNSYGESALSAQVSATPSERVPSGLMARFTFDDGTANDASGYGNHGTLLNRAAVVTDAERGKVLLLDGANDYMDLGNGTSLDLSDNQQATIAAWVKVAASKNHNTILSKGEWRDAYSLLIKGDRTPKDLLWTGNDTGVLSGDPVPLNLWTHVAVTINGDQTTFYLNGQLSGSANQDRGNGIDYTATGVALGREQVASSLPAGQHFFSGLMDDVRIYEVALTPAEIQAVMQSGSPNGAPAFPGG